MQRVAVESIWTVFTETTACLLGQATTGTFLQFFKVMLSQRKHLTVFVTERERAAKNPGGKKENWGSIDSAHLLVP